MSAIDNLGKLGGNAKNIALGVAVLGVVGIVVYVFFRGVKGAAKDTVKVAAGAVDGVVTGVGEVVGVPETDVDQCKKALAEGRYLDASFYCPAGTFVKGIFSSN